MTKQEQNSNITRYSALYNMINERCKFDEYVILSSGKRSTRYFDLRLLTLSGQYVHLIAHAFREELRKHDISIDDFDCIGGMEVGAIPIITTLVNAWGKYGFWVRKTPKDHGLMKNIEGWSTMHKNSNYLLVDDVVTTGQTMVKVQEALDKKRPVAMICIIDRMKERHYNLISLFRENDFPA
jgi:orotate phosphoribosyltransferase